RRLHPGGISAAVRAGGERIAIAGTLAGWTRRQPWPSQGPHQRIGGRNSADRPTILASTACRVVKAQPWPPVNPHPRPAAGTEPTALRSWLRLLVGWSRRSIGHQ